MTPDTLPPASRLQDGSALQVVLRGQTLCFHDQTREEKAWVKARLLYLRAQSHIDGEAERRKLRGARN